MFSKLAYTIFEKSIRDYHIKDDLHQPLVNPYAEGIERLLYHKNWIDTLQWHYEDLIRDPAIDPVVALALKRKIDASNQERTDMVEQIDDFFLSQYQYVAAQPAAAINSESPAWAIDRLSVLALKLYHMRQEAERTDAPPGYSARCAQRLKALEEQRQDLQTAIDQLLADIAAGRKYMKVYRQMKMYNDTEMNPVLRRATKPDAPH